jgi:uncharacterized protein YcgL (UPF0745 family)
LVSDNGIKGVVICIKDCLKDLKVNLAQGYYLSLPKTIEELLIEKAEKFRF